MIYFFGNILNILTVFNEIILDTNSDNNFIMVSVGLFLCILNKKHSLCEDLLNNYLGGWSWNLCYLI
jgi:hypothetical protein